MLNKKIKLPGDKDQTIQFAVDHFIYIGKHAIATHGKFHVALSGGSTPKAIFERLKENSLDWKNVHVFWSDERSVPPEDPDSNYKMAMDAGFSKLPIPPSQIHRMIAEKDIEENAAAYETLIKKEVGNKGFDLIMLGMGDDGHTASLFPGTKALNETQKLVVANEVPQKNTTRMTMTYPCINNADLVVLYVLGASKKEMIKDIIIENGSYPSSLAGTKENPSMWILDSEAASLIK